MTRINDTNLSARWLVNVRALMRGLCWVLLAAWLQAHAIGAFAHVATQPDGPYVVRGDDGGWEAWSVEVAEDELRRCVEPIQIGERLTIAGVGAFPAFEVQVRVAGTVAPGEISVPRAAPLFIVADTHGEFEILAELLQKHRVVDPRLKWSFGRGHLVFLGDVFDRGPNHTQVIAVQVYPRREPHSGRAIIESVLVKNGRLLRAKVDGSVEPLN